MNVITLLMAGRILTGCGGSLKGKCKIQSKLNWEMVSVCVAAPMYVTVYVWSEVFLQSGNGRMKPKCMKCQVNDVDQRFIETSGLSHILHLV